MSQPGVKLGDRVRHSSRPEWGVGTVIKVEQSAANGAMTPRVTVRFPNTGIKVLAALPIPLEVVTDEGDEPVDDERAIALASAFDAPDWLAPVAQKKALEAMMHLSMAVRDPFLSVRDRLKNTLDLYRFERTGSELIDWAVAQTRLDDPLSRFTRHELEQYFDRWAHERENHLKKLLGEARRDPEVTGELDELLKRAPARAQQVMRQHIGGR